jgi:uncharacterized Zn finger protein (UPF0148 family)
MSEAKEESALDGVVICPRCEKEVKNQEIGKARIDGEFAHVKCTQDELDEIGLDDFYD